MCVCAMCIPSWNNSNLLNHRLYCYDSYRTIFNRSFVLFYCAFIVIEEFFEFFFVTTVFFRYIVQSWLLRVRFIPFFERKQRNSDGFIVRKGVDVYFSILYVLFNWYSVNIINNKKQITLKYFNAFCDLEYCVSYTKYYCFRFANLTAAAVDDN